MSRLLGPIESTPYIGSRAGMVTRDANGIQRLSQPEVIQVKRLTGETIGGHRVVRSLGGYVWYADAANKDHADSVLGLTVTAANAYALTTIQMCGPLEELGWNWTPGKPLFLSGNSLLSHTPPTSGFVKQVAVAETATRIVIGLHPSIRKA